MSSTSDLSFLPDDFVARRAKARANRLCGSLLLVTILGVASAFTYAQQSLESVKREHALVNEKFRLESERLKRLDTLQKQQTELARRAKLAESLLEKMPRTEVLAALKKELPAGTSLMDVTLSSRPRMIVKTPEQILADKKAKKPSKQDKATAPDPAPKLYDVMLKVVGLAYTDMQVAEFINSLGKSACFEDVNLLVSREFSFQDQAVRRFEVDMRVRNEPKRSDKLAHTEDQAAQ